MILKGTSAFRSQSTISRWQLHRHHETWSLSKNASNSATYDLTYLRLAQVALLLATSGPDKHESTPKRVRVHLAGKIIFDTIESQLVWEHPYFPRYYLPQKSLQNATLGPGHDVEGAKGYKIHDLIVDGATTQEAVLSIETGPLADFVRPAPSRMDAWFEEDEPIHGHPVDPYKRIDTRRSSRPIRVEVDGVEVANATWAVHLYETSLPVRFYLPRTSIKDGVGLLKSDTTSYCPYKGSAKYLHVIPEKGIEPVRDIVWYYEEPLLAVEGIRELVCFYNEKVDIWIDGVKQPRPKTHFV